MSKLTLPFLLLLLAAAPVHAGPVTYRTDTGQLCLGATGCSVSEQTIDGVRTVRFRPIASSTVNVSGQSFASLGQLVIRCVGGGTACANQLLDGLNLFINVAQTAPSLGNGSFFAGAITGSIRGTASTAVVTWSAAMVGGSGARVGPIRYAVANNARALVPPTTNAGRTSIQVVIADTTHVFSTTASQLCVGSAGCGVSEQTVGGVLVRYEPVSASRIEADPSGFASFGRIVTACVGGGTACANTALVNLNLNTNITQAAPIVSNVSLPAAAIVSTGGGAGSVGGSASSVRLQWQGCCQRRDRPAGLRRREHAAGPGAPIHQRRCHVDPGAHRPRGGVCERLRVGAGQAISAQASQTRATFAHPLSPADGADVAQLQPEGATPLVAPMALRIRWRRLPGVPRCTGTLAARYWP